MKYKVMKEWVKALRSGKYGQTTRRLTDNEGNFCCLGVLCDLYRKDKKISKKKAFVGLCGIGDVPDGTVVKWAGLKTHNPTTPSNGKSLAEMNDDRKSFHDIADVIEASYKSL